MGLGPIFFVGGRSEERWADAHLTALPQEKSAKQKAQTKFRRVN
jgi:hypothetical protein